ncbi:MAG: hypothetical protein IPK68_20305 [Bdellovibrionales bacterium]|nr:hypothetical protein [Bdellovibrionales bacterium]
MRVCGGGKSGTYIKVAKYLKYMLEASGGNKTFDVAIYSTSGSKENIEAINDNRCDVAVIQHDATAWFRSNSADNPIDLRIASTAYNEHAHLICHRDLGVKSFSDLEGLSENGQGTVFIGSLQSGGAMTLENLKAFYPSAYGKIDATPVESTLDPAGNVKFDATQNSIRAAVENKACAFFVTRAPYKYLVDLPSEVAEKLNLADINDWKFNDLKEGGEKVYEFVPYHEISPVDGSKIYETLRKISWGRTTDTTLMVSADLVVNSEWEKNMIAALKESQRPGAAQRWQNNLEKIGSKQGDFSQLESPFRNINVTPLPELPQQQ